MADMKGWEHRDYIKEKYEAGYGKQDVAYALMRKVGKDYSISSQTIGIILKELGVKIRSHQKQNKMNRAREGRYVDFSIVPDRGN